MSDCLRHLDRALGGHTNIHVTTAHACADALWRVDRDLRAYLRVKARLWAFELWFSRRPLDRAAVAVNVPDRTSGFAKDDRD